MRVRFNIIMADDDLMREVTTSTSRGREWILVEVGTFGGGGRSRLFAEAAERANRWCVQERDPDDALAQCILRTPALLMMLFAADQGVDLFTPDLARDGPSGAGSHGSCGEVAPCFSKSPPTLEDVGRFIAARRVPCDWSDCKAFGENLLRLHRCVPLHAPSCVVLDLMWLPDRNDVPSDNTYVDVTELEQADEGGGVTEIRRTREAWRDALRQTGNDWFSLPPAQEGLPLLLKRSLAREEVIPRIPVVVATQIGGGNRYRGAVAACVEAGAAYAYTKKDLFAVRVEQAENEGERPALNEEGRQRLQEGLCVLIGSVLTVARRWAAGRQPLRPPDTGSLLEMLPPPAAEGALATPSGAMGMAMLSDVILVNAQDKELAQLVLQEFLPPPLVEWVDCAEPRDLETAFQRVLLAQGGEEVVVFVTEELFVPPHPRLEQELTRLFRLIVTRNWRRPFTKPVKLVAQYRGPIDRNQPAVAISDLRDLTGMPEALARAQADVITAVGPEGLDRALVNLDLAMMSSETLRDRLAEIVDHWLRSALIARGAGRTKVGIR